MQLQSYNLVSHMKYRNQYKSPTKSNVIISGEKYTVMNYEVVRCVLFKSGIDMRKV